VYRPLFGKETLLDEPLRLYLRMWFIKSNTTMFVLGLNCCCGRCKAQRCASGTCAKI